MGLDPSSPEMTFVLVMLHTGTMFAVIVYFWKAWREHYFSSATVFRSVAINVVIATVITGIVGLALQWLIEKVFLKGNAKAEVETLFSQLPLIGAALLAAGLLIIYSGMREERKKARSRYQRFASVLDWGCSGALFTVSRIFPFWRDDLDRFTAEGRSAPHGRIQFCLGGGIDAAGDRPRSVAAVQVALGDKSAYAFAARRVARDVWIGLQFRGRMVRAPVVVKLVGSRSLEVFWLLLCHCRDRRVWAGFGRVVRSSERIFSSTPSGRRRKCQKRWNRRIHILIRASKAGLRGRKTNSTLVRCNRRKLSPRTRHWLRMDPSLTRAVLAKTEEELLGSLAALMRNKVEHEQASRRFAQTQIDTEQAKRELERVKEQIRHAEEEVATRLNEQSRINEEIVRVRQELAVLREAHQQHTEMVSGLKNEAAQTQQALAEAHRNLSGVKEAAETQLAAHRETSAQLAQVKNEKATLEETLVPLQRGGG